MYNQFIPSFHYASPDSKLEKSWCWDAVQYCWYQTNNHNLLEGKDVAEINGYASGKFDMRLFKRMYKSEAKKMDAKQYTANSNIDVDELGYVPIALITNKLNAATAIIQKIPVEIKAEAIDAFAAKKKSEDITFLKNKPALEADLQPLADQMGLGTIDLGTTKHSSIPFSDSPYGLDLHEPDELQVFVDLLYGLAIEAAFETALQTMWETKNCNQIKLLEIKDQFKFGVSCHMAFESAITSLPDIEYVYPANIETPSSDLPDFSDNTHRFINRRVTALELMNYFGNEICDENALDKIINEYPDGYCNCNGRKDTIPFNDFGSFKVDLVYCEIKSIDYVGVTQKSKKSKFRYVVTDTDEAKKCTNKVWGQNTYCFWWLRNTKHFFGIHRLGFSHRTVGQESYQSFSTNIYKSQEKSAVEASVGENKKAQIADIKMQHAIIKSLPAGKYIDLRFLRGVLSGLKDEPNKYTMQELLELAMEQNYVLGDTEGFEGKNDGQFKPFIDIPGGVKTEVLGYMQVIADASQKISQFTGINDQLTGQSANPEGLVGLQKLLINSSINALHHVNEAIENQYRKLFTNWATIIKSAIEKGGKAKKSIVNMIGAKKVSLIDALDEIPLHQMGIKVDIHQREEERQLFLEQLMKLEQKGVINTSDIYMLMGVDNPKDRFALLAVKEKQWEKRMERQRQEDMANQQAMIQAQGQNQQAIMDKKVEGDVKTIYAQGDVSSKILELAAEKGIQAAQLDAAIKEILQRNRGSDQLNKSIKTLQTKNELEQQKPFGE